jgi:hypothetical protein
MALVGCQFAILISISQDGVNVYYVMPDKIRKIMTYSCTYFWGKRFDENDRKNLTNSKTMTIYEHIIEELKILAEGLVNHWRNVLSGDKSWITDFENERKIDKIADAFNKIAEADVNITKVLKPIFDRQ